MATATERISEQRPTSRRGTKIRAHQLASELGIAWRDLQELAQREGLHIRNQLCGLTEEEANILRGAHRRQQEGAALPVSAPRTDEKALQQEVSPVVAATSPELSPPEATRPAVDQKTLASIETPPPTPQELTVVASATAHTSAESVTEPGSKEKPIISTPAASLGTSSREPAKEEVSPGAKPGASTATSPRPSMPASPNVPKQVKHIVNLDKLRQRQQELKQQAQQQAGLGPGVVTTPTRPQPPTTTTPPATSPTAPAAPSSPPSAPMQPTPLSGKTATSGPIPVLQKVKPSAPAATHAPQKTSTTPPVAFVVRKPTQKSAKEKEKDKPSKAPQEQKPLATLEEIIKQQQQQPKPIPSPPDKQLQLPEKSKADTQIKLTKEHVDLSIEADEEDELRPIGKRRPGVFIGREERRLRRREEARLRATQTAADTLVEPEAEAEEARPVARRVRAEGKPPAPRPVTQPRKGKVPIEPPITVRSLSEALGVSVQDLLRKLVQRGQMLNVNATLPDELAEELAIEYNLELEIKKPADPEEEILKQLQAPDRPEDLVPRPPVVTVMGHVDHGKTSLLDRIRESDIASTEAGGITQHLRAWQVEHGGRPITFLDTPGHEAFTAMRARGAHVTDIVVLVVAADDGVMPQTEEAISHARAANVPIIVAINKVDLPNANVLRTRNQLYSLGLIPDTMGGDVPFVETVAAKDRARGIQELLDMISVLAELRELKANPKKPALGTCLEAKVTEGQGVVATLLVQNGTLHVGDCIVCGTSYGRVRAMLDCNGRPIQQAGPATPVAVAGLDEVPEAGDKFFGVPDLATARTIVEKRRERLRFSGPVRPATFRLEDLAKGEVQELKIILKADVRGSIEAIRKELEKLQHPEIKLTIIHAGVGAITEGDVQLALASPKDTLIVGFNVVPDHRAQSLAEQRNVSIRLYNIIYQLTEDLKAALEGRLKPREEIVPLGRAVVREVFKISKVGTVAGCYVTQGVVERGAQVRVIREGRVIYPPADRSAVIESLRRFKEDVREVREGFECGIKISNFDDVKVDDVLEIFRIVQVQRTLDEKASHPSPN
ncbi:MAG: translation initiation factor IF-2 [Gemmatales bacterium]|nr:translation initiation factor IF-2 [Gemmatales bacterium]MDW7993686.1 translation initiation factor IF-2 [Gemmatales bacterium]